MSRRTVGTAAVALSLSLVAAPAWADLIIPGDFVITQAWKLEQCQTYAFASGAVTGCLEGVLAFGLSTTSGEYGFSEDVPDVTVSGMAPGQLGPFVFGYLCDAQFASPTLARRIIFPGPVGFCSDGALHGHGLIYSPLLVADDRLVLAVASFQGSETPVSGNTDFFRQFPVRISPTTIPEPQPFILLATGLALLVVVRWRRARG